MTRASVDQRKCSELAALLKQHVIPQDREDSETLVFAPDETGNYYLLLVAICHQTQHLKGVLQGKEYRGWDYLSGRLKQEISQDPALLSPQSWIAMTEDRLAALFKDPLYGNTLSDIAGRTSLVRNLGAVMLSKSWTHAQCLYDREQGVLSNPPRGILSALLQFHAYNDPVHKKAYFLLGLMRNSGLWEYADIHNLGPPVDYHEVRGHLRLGTVVINDIELLEKIKQHDPVSVSEDIDIRRAVRDAIMLIAKEDGLPQAMTLHYLFWNLFRNICQREHPHCTSGAETSLLPGRYRGFILRSDSGNYCGLSSICSSISNPAKLQEHVFVTDWY